MLNMKIQFSWLGVIIFLLPMLINVVYFVMENNNATEEAICPYQWLVMIEQVTRILYAIAMCVLVSKRNIDWKSPFLYLGIIFLILYYIVWIRYFMGGMEISLMKKSFLFVPIPLAVFPVLYFIFASCWLNNYIAVAIMIVFGISHYAVSYLSFNR